MWLSWRCSYQKQKTPNKIRFYVGTIYASIYMSRISSVTYLEIREKNSKTNLNLPTELVIYLILIAHSHLVLVHPKLLTTKKWD
jgi:hypothetical protein